MWESSACVNLGQITKSYFHGSYKRYNKFFCGHPDKNQFLHTCIWKLHWKVKKRLFFQTAEDDITNFNVPLVVFWNRWLCHFLPRATLFWRYTFIRERILATGYYIGLKRKKIKHTAKADKTVQKLQGEGEKLSAEKFDFLFWIINVLGTLGFRGANKTGWKNRCEQEIAITRRKQSHCNLICMQCNEAGCILMQVLVLTWKEMMRVVPIWS